MKKPNLLFIFTDEQAAETMAVYGNELIHTPNMDSLANDSLVFKNTYVTQPVCTPSRSTLMTGLYPHTTGCTENNAVLPSEAQCLPELGDFSAYQTAYIGKWHLGDEVFAQHGFAEWVSVEDAYYPYYTQGRDRLTQSAYAKFLAANGFEPDIHKENGFTGFSRSLAASLPEPYSKAAYVGNMACDFIKRNQENPFLLCVNFFEPHMPFTGCRNGQYDPDAIPLPETFATPIYDNQHPKLKLFQKGYYDRGVGKLPLKTEADWRRMRANYWGLISLVDTYLGKIITTLKECGLYDETIIVYTSDHGDMMGDRKLVGKCNMLQNAVRVPCLLKVPGLQPKRIDANFSQIDLVPTLLDFMGQAIPGHLEGQSWKEHLVNGGTLRQTDVLIEWSGYNNGFGDGDDRWLQIWKDLYSEDELRKMIGDPLLTVITPDGWKYTRSNYYQDELYNLNADPYESVNLAAGAEYRSLVADLKAKIRRWEKESADWRFNHSTLEKP